MCCIYSSSVQSPFFKIQFLVLDILELRLQLYATTVNKCGSFHETVNKSYNKSILCSWREKNRVRKYIYAKCSFNSCPISTILALEVNISIHIQFRVLNIPIYTGILLLCYIPCSIQSNDTFFQDEREKISPFPLSEHQFIHHQIQFGCLSYTLVLFSIYSNIAG